MKVKRSPLLYVAPTAIIICSLLPLILPHTFIGRKLSNEPLHSTLEALGAFVSIAIAWFLFREKKEKHNEKYFLLAMGFLTMGLFDVFHAITVPGQDFVLLRSIAALSGGFWFSLVWLPRSIVVRIAGWKKWFPFFVTAGSVLLGIWILHFREMLPLMVENDKFTDTAIAINYLAGVFFLISTGRLLIDFRRFDNYEIYLFACMSLLFGLSSLVFPYSYLWCSHWWWWHLLRLLAYLLAIVLLGHWYLQTVSTLRVAIAEQKQAEEALRYSEKKYRDLVDNTLVGVYQTDIKGNFLFVNDALVRMLEFELPEELISRGVFERYKNPKDREALIENLKKTGMVTDFELELLTKTGRTKNVLVSAILNGDVLSGMTMDITKRKHAEEALRESEERYRGLIESARDAIYTLSPTGTITSLNPVFETLTGWSYAEWIGKSFSSILHPEDLPIAIDLFQRVLNGETTPVFELRILTKSGEYKIGEFSNTLQIQKGRVVGILGVARDITERKRAEEDIERLHHQNELILNSAGEGILGIDLQGKHTFINPSAARMFGYELEELIGLHSHTTWHHRRPDGSPYPPEECKIYAAFRNGGIHTVDDEVFWRKDGTSFPVRYTSTPILEDGKLVGAVVTFRDITERKLAEESLRETRDYLEKLLNYANAPIIVWDTKSIITSFNHAFERFTGYTNKEVIGKELHILFPEASKEESLKKIERTLSGEYWESVEIPILCKDGSIRLALWNSANIYAKDAMTLVATIAQGQDITGRKRAEQEICMLNEELEQRVLQRTAQLEAANKDMEAFSYSVSHDLRAPLRAITGFSSMLLEDYADKVDDEGKRILNVVKDNTLNMSALIDDLLTLSRIGRKEIEHLKIDMDKLAQTTFDKIKTTVPEREVKFDIKPLPPAYGDEGLLHQVFFNLLFNAIKFTRHRENAIIEVGGYAEGIENVYYVKDNGIGFDMQYADKLFGAFQRLHSDKQFEGTGIGLAIVQRVIQRHDGRVWAEGKVNEGATFYFTLPKH